MNYHSNENQKILGKFVDREVIKNASPLIEDLLQIEKISYDDIENYYVATCPECGEIEADSDRADEKVNDMYHCAYCKAEFDEWESEPQEIYEWWFVTSMLYEDLRGRGEPVIDSDYGYLWGRTCTGQAILLDNVIGSIAEDMGILDGQKYSWAE